MNSRGLMELIILNIGLQKGVIGPALFSIMVVMAIVTTLMATPLFELFYGRHARKAGTLPQTA
jgi:Kef-type K+ transport system membrane component KefB